MFKSWKDSLLKEYPRLSPETKFRFNCNKGISCFNRCCSNVNIFLTPYDVLRLKKALDISSGEFLGKYTVPLLSEHQLSMVILKMNNDEGKTCPFVTSEGCSVYSDRPWACRMFPVGTTLSNEDQANSEEYCFIAEEGSPCLGIKGTSEWTVSEWFKNQGIDQYDKINKPYKAITLHSMFREGQGLTLPKAQMFYIALYDLDRFRSLIFDSSFFSRFDIKETVKKKIKIDDEALLKFGFDWVRFGLFGEDTIKIQGDITEKNKRKK